MEKFYAILFAAVIYLLLNSNLRGQVLNGDTTLTTQAQVDSFSFTSVTGTLRIAEADSGNIKNLDSLKRITSLGGLSVELNKLLESIDLPRMTSIGQVYVFGNGMLDRINFQSTQNTMFFLTLLSNESLRSVSIPGVPGIDSVFRIQKNPGLSEIEMPGLKSVNDSIIIEDNCSLPNMNGLFNLKSVGDFIIRNNASLTDFCGLYNLVTSGTITGSLVISGNAVNPTIEQIAAEGPCPESDSGNLTDTEILPGLPSEYILEQNYPNPFNPSTNIIFVIPANADNITVALKVYDMLGSEVAVLLNEEKSGGEYKIKFDGSNLASGIYMVQLKAGDFISVKKICLVR